MTERLTFPNDVDFSLTGVMWAWRTFKDRWNDGRPMYFVVHAPAEAARLIQEIKETLVQSGHADIFIFPTVTQRGGHWKIYAYEERNGEAQAWMESGTA